MTEMLKIAVVFEDRSEGNLPAEQILETEIRAGRVCLAAMCSEKENGSLPPWNAPTVPATELAEVPADYFVYFRAAKKTQHRDSFSVRMKQSLPRGIVDNGRRLVAFVMKEKNRRLWDSFTGWDQPLPCPTGESVSHYSPLGLYNVPGKKVIPDKVLLLPGFTADKYIRLREKGISFVSEDCWAGLMYNTLGMEMQSPFINMFMYPEDYRKLIGNLPFYLNQPLIPRRIRRSGKGLYYYPVVTIGDVGIHFNHVHNPQELMTYAENWYRRRERMRMDRLFVKCATEDGETLREYTELLNGKNYPHVIFSSVPSDRPDTVFLPDFVAHREMYKDGLRECARECAKNTLPSGMPFDIWEAYLNGTIVRTGENNL